MLGTRTRPVVVVALAALLVCFGAQTSQADADYGSGALGDWSQYSRVTSTVSFIQRVRNADGLYMMGDSISVSTARQLAEMLLPTSNLLAVDNWSGRPTTPTVDEMSEWISTHGAPRRLLLATGSNDIFNPPVMTAQIDRLMQAAGPTRKVFWVSVWCSRTYKPVAVQAADKRNSEWVNSQIYAASKRWPNLIVIPWDIWLSSKPFRYKLYLRDGVHTSTLGSVFRNTIIRDAILSQTRV